MLDFGLFWAGIFLGVLYFGMILLPLLYGLPRASIWAFRGWVRARAPLAYLWDAVRWSIVLVGLLVALGTYFPTAYSMLRDSPGLNWGSMVGVLVAAGYALFHPSGRRARQVDFVDLMRRRYLTTAGATMLGLSGEQLSPENKGKLLTDREDKPRDDIKPKKAAWSNRLDEMLVKSNLITVDQLKEAISRQSTSGGNLGSNLVQLGHLTEERLARFLAEQYSVPLIDLADQDIDPSVINFVPAEIAQKHTVIPIKRKENVLTVAMADPTNVFAIDDIHFLAGFNVEPVVATETHIRNAINRYYHSVEVDPRDATA